jgi:hypothetical protein
MCEIVRDASNIILDGRMTEVTVVTVKARK